MIVWLDEERMVLQDVEQQFFLGIDDDADALCRPDGP
jgi:hypothetical protein